MSVKKIEVQQVNKIHVDYRVDFVKRVVVVVVVPVLDRQPFILQLNSFNLR